MKKFVFLLIAVMCFALLPTQEATAQRDYFEAESYVTDTLTNTGTVYATFGRMTRAWDYVIFATADTTGVGKASGSIFLEVSPDGSNWITHPTADTLTYTTVGDEMLTSVLSGTGLVYPYMRANITGTGSSVSIWTIDLILKK